MQISLGHFQHIHKHGTLKYIRLIYENSANN